jgi:uncharacterized membrane protein YhiD involved in acid resistance
MFDSIINLATATSTGSSLTIQSALICTSVSIVLGFIIAIAYMVKTEYTKSYIVTLVLLPVLTQVVIMMVNGNLGTGIAVMGAFSLVRFRSIPGGAKQILGIFFAMSIGLATGMGYITFAIAMTVIIALVMIILNISSFGSKKNKTSNLKIVIPEDVDYSNIFDDLFDTYTRFSELTRVKTTNMGTMYELNYNVILKEDGKMKELIDDIRSRNGNLTVVFSRLPENIEEL